MGKPWRRPTAGSKASLGPAGRHLGGGTPTRPPPTRHEAGRKARTAHPLLFLLHPAVLLVGVQLPGKPQVLERVHEGAVQYLLQHVATGSQQALQGGPHCQAWLCPCRQEGGEPAQMEGPGPPAARLPYPPCPVLLRQRQLMGIATNPLPDPKQG